VRKSGSVCSALTSKMFRQASKGVPVVRVNRSRTTTAVAV
jgi:hypothetical protein